MTINETISKNLRKFRKEKGLSQKEIGEQLKVGGATVSSWEKGNTQINIEMLYKFCKIVNKSITEIMEIEENKELSQKENELIKDYRKINKKGKQEAEKRIKELTYIPEYTQEEEFLKEKILYLKDYISPIRTSCKGGFNHEN